MRDLGTKAGFAQSRAPNGQKRISWALKSRSVARLLRQHETGRDIEREAKLPDTEGLPSFGL
ncbi:hypothetical protein NKI77_33380 [Mesorhizobium opportunistum]|uniref:Uncharacterized protein n=1 Tax=Mesorhizobium opportunistum TaxID=593909 RepID=A0ABV1YRJ1_9HYPH|nr:hypothetical protein [Mesorhizobium sp.]